jgi:peroxiredoxin
MKLTLFSAIAAFAAAVDVGFTIPSGTTLDFGFPPEKIDLAARTAGKTVLLVGLPGAFTPT